MRCVIIKSWLKQFQEDFVKGFAGPSKKSSTEQRKTDDSEPARDSKRDAKKNTWRFHEPEEVTVEGKVVTS